MKGHDAEIAELQRENAELRAQLVEARRPPIKRFVMPGAGGFQMPTADELVRLKATVLRAYPILRPTPGEKPEAEFSESFSNSFVALSAMPRAHGDALNLALDKVTWCNRAEDLLQGAGALSSTITVAGFTAAIIAHDVAHAPISRWPHDQAYALGNHQGTWPVDQWRKVLSRGVRPPTPLPVQVHEVRSHQLDMVRGGDRNVGAGYLR